MLVDIQLGTRQINQFASCIDTKDVKNYIDNNKKEYEQFLKEEQEKERTKYKR